MAKTTKDVLAELAELEAKMAAIKTSPEFQEKKEEIKAIKKAQAKENSKAYRKSYRLRKQQAFTFVRELEAYGLNDTVRKMLEEAKSQVQAK